MKRSAALAMLATIWATTTTARAATPDDAAETFFELKIRPVLAGTCFKCHGDKKTSNHLRVDSRAALVRGGDTGPAIVPGDPAQSLLVQAMRHEHESIKMPPDKRLPDDAIAAFEHWVKQGAPWPVASSNSARPFASARHWAFEPVRAIEPPSDPTGWADQPIDRFIAAGQKARGLVPVRLADRRTLIRRATFDLTGLPPTPDEVAAFVADPSPLAYDQLIDRLLASPRYGERWGRHWMDVARYSDTAGDNADYPIPEARLYRDYIIDAFNQDKPYDEFVREQIAGDILARTGPRERYAERVIATGFLALSRRYATAPEELWHLTLEDTIETTGRAFLGLTLRCARCHDHKFDPVTKEDYYALYGIFASTKFAYAGSEEFASKNFPRMSFQPLVPPDQAAPQLRAHEARLHWLGEEISRIEQHDPLVRRAAWLKGQIAALAQAIAPLDAAHQDARPLKNQLEKWRSERAAALAQTAARLDPLRAESRVRQRRGLPPDLPGAYAVADAKAVDEAVHLKGDPAQRGSVVPRNVIRFLAGPNPPRIPGDTSGRLQLAQWITRADHPLTARVIANRIWQHHFGRGIVASASNFGLRGEEPSFPELLDWLGSRFVADGWSIKSLHRLIMLSKTYQLASDDHAGNAVTDPGNIYLWRHDRRRLDAESIRDAMLAVSGALELDRPGEHPFPPIADWGWTQHNAFKAVYPSQHRSVYLMTQRLVRHPYLSLFDGPDPNFSTDVRTSATVPLQALYLMNNPFVREQAERFAGRLIAASSNPRDRVALAHEIAWGRPAEPVEIERAVAFLARYSAESIRSGEAPDRVERESWASLARVMLTSNEFFYVE